MIDLVLVSAGGIAGAVTRYKLGAWLTSLKPDSVFPLSTVLINIAGSFLIGVCYSLSEKHQILTENQRLLLVTGVLGSFTTFSAFSIESLLLLKRTEYAYFFFNIVLSVVGGLLAAAAGTRL